MASDKSGKEAGGTGRRGFLRVLGTTAAGAAVAVPLVAAGPAEAKESEADRVKARYKETDHVKTYYRTNRY